MKERPILFSDEMVRAILDGRKTQTRRALKKQPACGCFFRINDRGEALHLSDVPGHEIVPFSAESASHRLRCPYGVAGDRLWVREAWCLACDYDGVPLEVERVYYRATDPHVEGVGERKDGTQRSPWRPSIHMRREWSRIALEVTEIRVQRLGDISGNDARAEGVDDLRSDERGAFEEMALRRRYMQLWERINGMNSWAANPWVWAITFELREARR